MYLPPLLLRLQRLHKREFGLHRFAVLCTYQEANFAYERACGVGFSADKFYKKFKLESNQMAQGHLSNCCTSSSCFERSCFLQSIRGSSNPRENGRSSFRLKLHAYPSIICRQFVVVRASLPPHHHHPSSSSSLTSAATSSFSSNKTLECPPPHGLLLRYTSLSRRTGGFVPCNAARSSALSESEEMMPTTSRRVTDNRLPQLVDVVPPVVEFKLSDFELCSHVSVGLAGRVSVFVFPLFLSCLLCFDLSSRKPILCNCKYNNILFLFLLIHSPQLQQEKNWHIHSTPWMTHKHSSFADRMHIFTIQGYVCSELVLGLDLL